jgi:citrate synthase
MEPWHTAIVHAQDGEIRLQGYDVTALMTTRTFTDTIYLLHRGRLPSPTERGLLDAILTGVADHGSGAPSCATARLALSGNRGSLSSACAAGLLAVGDEHGGAGLNCMEMLAAGLAAARADGTSMEETAERIVAQARHDRRRVPGFGHRVHTRDPRTPVLFQMARAGGVAADGIALMEALERSLTRTVKRLPINIDGALAAVLHDLGFAPAFGRFVFFIGRMAGITAEVGEELSREKPMRIRVPVQYDGPAPRDIE